MASPAIACIGIIGKHVRTASSHSRRPAPQLTPLQDNPLHIALFPPHENEILDMSFLLNTCLDVVDIRRAHKTIGQDLGLLQAVNERLAAYGWLTNTGVKFVIVVDMAGRPPPPPPPPDEGIRRPPPVVGLRDSDLKPAFRAIQTAYIHLLQNPFYMPDDATPMALARSQGRAAEIKNQRLISEINRIGNA